MIDGRPRATWQFLVQLVTPYRGSLVRVALALVVQAMARLASPWSLKVASAAGISV